MSINNVPNSRNELIQFYQEHYEIWEAAGASVGLSPELALAVKTAVETASASLTSANLARNSSKAATAKLNSDAEVLREVGGAAVATIRAFAEATNNPDVYDIAKLAPPSPPTPVGPPTSPTDFNADPNADGTITLTWKGTLSQNQSFDIERSIDGGAFTFVKNVRGKRWLDDRVPMNSVSITYRAYGVREAKRSDSPATTQVLFGNLPPELLAAFRSGPESVAA